ncbi:type I pullulanase [uncultured Tyzzerella sp.]|uniref:type I pullulanase n=1 Tax=uncultured Tyzzerella sp. TaxID=2321398 RepID=UPI002943BC80|nr:type I pullulanase [uncultured Tyzzerella sp.]
MNIKDKKTPLEWKKIFTSNEFEEKYKYLENDLGYKYRKEETIFKVWAPTAKMVTINIYTKGSDREEGSKKINSFNMKENEQGIWSIAIKEDLKDLYYTYTINANGETNETNDINAKACGVNGKRSMIIDLKDTNPKDWENDTRPNIPIEERVIYELHIRDFSYDENSGIDDKYRGKYLAFTQKGTTLKEDKNYKTGIDYIKDLGITYVHLLPFYDFGSIDETSNEDDFNWGYDPVNYNVPEGSYSTNAYDGKVRIKEAKEMIKSLHNEGIGVIMDVVYNHTFSRDSSFNKTVPYYYYRINDNGDYSNGSACGNETASDNIMYRKYMIDSILYWAKEYHIDGFRFDLMGVHDVETMNEIRSALDKEFGKGKILIYGEPWFASDVSMRKDSLPAVKENLNKLDENISAFCDVIRDLVKGDVFIEKNCGFVNGNDEFSLKLKDYLYKVWNNIEIEYFTAKAPKQFINYVSAHDNLTLWDKLIITNNKEPNFKIYDEDIIKQNKLSAGIVFTTCGIPFFQAGEEFARTKEGDENSYKSSSRLNALDWNISKEYIHLVNYYKELIKIRKSLPVLCNPDKNYVKKVDILNEKGLIIINIEKEDNCKQKYNEVCIMYNQSNNYQEYILKDNEWKILFSNKEDKVNNNKLNISDKSICILGSINKDKILSKK